MTRVYLTIDDSPSPHLAEKVDVLRERGIPAVFFCEGGQLDERPEPARYAVRNGYVVGNHSHTHRSFSQMSLDECKREIRNADERIDELYRAVGVSRPAKWFRFPFGDRGDSFQAGSAEKRAELQRFLAAEGYGKPDFDGVTYDWCRADDLGKTNDWYWTFSAEAYRCDSFESVLERVHADDPANGKGLPDSSSADIILYHDHIATHGWFERFLDELESLDVEFCDPLDV